MFSKKVQTVCLLMTCMLLCYAVQEMTFVRGRYLSHYGAFVVNVPSMFQCAEICQALGVCKSISFDNNNRICKINSITWPIDSLKVGQDFIYAEKANLPKNELEGNGTINCGELEIRINQLCYPLYQCTDSVISKTCDYYSSIGGCDEANIGKNLTQEYNLTSNDWSWLQTQCKRSCKLCHHNF